MKTPLTGYRSNVFGSLIMRWDTRRVYYATIYIDFQIEMFDTMVLPILMYGCEIWGFANNNMIESFCLQFYKSILGLKKCTPNCILYGELGRFPIDIFIKCRMVAFWKRIFCNKQDKIAVTLYKLLYKMHVQNFFHSK